ncbi:MAG: hypothetical protein ABWY36_06905 [Leifsonia sp.]
MRTTTAACILVLSIAILSACAPSSAPPATSAPSADSTPPPGPTAEPVATELTCDLVMPSASLAALLEAEIPAAEPPAPEPDSIPGTLHCLWNDPQLEEGPALAVAVEPSGADGLDTELTTGGYPYEIDPTAGDGTWIFCSDGLVTYCEYRALTGEDVIAVSVARGPGDGELERLRQDAGPHVRDIIARVAAAHPA